MPVFNVKLTVCVNGTDIKLATCFKTTGEISSYPEEEVLNAVIHFTISKLVTGYKYIEKLGELCG